MGTDNGKTRFSLATISQGGSVVPVVIRDGRAWPIAAIASELAPLLDRSGLLGLFSDWDRCIALLEGRLAQPTEAMKAAALAEEDLSFLAPLQYPSKLVLTGTNYYDHVRAAGYPDFSKETSFPAFFMKPPSTALVGPGRTVPYPRGVLQLDWEVELAVIIGRTARRIKAADALDHIAAYAVGIDFSARDLQRNPRHFAKMDLFLGKAFDGGCPLGPRIVPARFVDDPQKLGLRLWRNGVIQQDSSTEHMIWSIAEQLEEITNNTTLVPGDVLMTGPPAGTGLEKGEYLSVGDILDAEVDGLGRLSVEIC